MRESESNRERGNLKRGNDIMPLPVNLTYYAVAYAQTVQAFKKKLGHKYHHSFDWY